MLLRVPLSQEYLAETLILRTSFGDIRVRPFYQLAPNLTALVMQLASKEHCTACRFYRNEQAPTKEQEWGPPYGLLQGSMAGMARSPPTTEGHIVMKTGQLAFIPGTKVGLSSL